MKLPKKIHFILGFALVWLSACAAVNIRPEKSDEFSGGLKVGDIVETSSGKTISLEQLLRELSRVKLIYIGETHSSIDDHRTQLRIAKEIYRQNEAIVIGMEMLPRNEQSVLDSFLTGALSEEDFLREVDWKNTWGYPFQLYRDIFLWAKSNHIRIAALNAPNHIVRKIARNGLSSLQANERILIAADFHTDDPEHRAHIFNQYQMHHKESIKDFQSFLEAQLAWEETMAETLASLVEKGAANEQIIVLLGKGHMSNRLGVPRLTLERTAQPYKTIAPMPVDFLGSVVDPQIADYVWITDRSLAFRRGQLGILVRSMGSGSGLEVLEVKPGSPVEKAGLKKGDIILSIDGVPVNEITKLHEMVSQGRTFLTFTLRRGREEISVFVAPTQ